LKRIRRTERELTHPDEKRCRLVLIRGCLPIRQGKGYSSMALWVRLMMKDEYRKVWNDVTREHQPVRHSIMPE